MMRSLTGGSAGLPDAFGQIGSRFGKSCSVPGEPLLAYLLGDCAPKAIAAKFGREKYHKRSENIGDNARGEGAVAWVDPTACPTEIQQKRTCLRIPAQSRFEVVCFAQVDSQQEKIGTSLAYRRDSFVAGPCIDKGISVR